MHLEAHLVDAGVFCNCTVSPSIPSLQLTRPGGSLASVAAMDVRIALDLLGVSSENDLTVKELKKAFKRKSLSMLPEKHPTIANAHSQFEEVNEAFLKVKLRTDPKSYHIMCVVCRAGRQWTRSPRQPTCGPLSCPGRSSFQTSRSASRSSLTPPGPGRRS